MCEYQVLCVLSIKYNEEEKKNLLLTLDIQFPREGYLLINEFYL